jgi:hypothetical protein
MSERDFIDSKLRALIIAVLRDEHGDNAVIYRTYDGQVVKDQTDWSVLSWPEPAFPILAIDIARTIESAAHNLWRRYAETARGDGRSWLELADGLGIDPNEDERDHLAFVKVAGEPTSYYSDRYVSWKCSSCGERIRDVGPYGGHPDDNERGHAPDCARHAAEIAEYEKRWEDE